MSDATYTEFNQWLIQPGNHRLLLSIKEKLQRFLKKDVDIASWQDVYNLFEESFRKNNRSKVLFEPLLSAHPPTLRSGASEEQIRLYRGAYVNKDTLIDKDVDKRKITYRGQKIEVTKKVAQPTTDNASEKTSRSTESARPRYYRGVRVN